MSRSLTLLLILCGMSEAQFQGNRLGFRQQQQPRAQAVQRFPQQQPAGRLPDYRVLCQTLNNPALVRQYVNCAIDIPGACNSINDVAGIREYLKSALPAALGRGRCSFCNPTDQVKIAFIAREFNRRYKAETGQILRHFRQQIAANGGFRAQTAADLVGAPANCNFVG